MVRFLLVFTAPASVHSYFLCLVKQRDSKLFSSWLFKSWHFGIKFIIVHIYSPTSCYVLGALMSKASTILFRLLTLLIFICQPVYLFITFRTWSHAETWSSQRGPPWEVHVSRRRARQDVARPSRKGCWLERDWVRELIRGVSLCCFSNMITQVIFILLHQV